MLSVKHLLGIKELSVSDMEQIFITADSFKQVLQRQIRKVPTLRDTTVANIFLRTPPVPAFLLSLPKSGWAQRWLILPLQILRCKR